MKTKFSKFKIDIYGFYLSNIIIKFSKKIKKISKKYIYNCIMKYIKCQTNKFEQLLILIKLKHILKRKKKYRLFTYHYAYPVYSKSVVVHQLEIFARIDMSRIFALCRFLSELFRSI